MQRRRNVGACIKLIEAPNETRKHIVSWEDMRPQVLACRKDDKEQQRYRVGEDNVFHQPDKGRFITEKRIDNHSAYIDKPEHVREDKPLIERDVVIHPAVCRKIVWNIPKPFKKKENDPEQRPEKQHGPMTEFRSEIIHFRLVCPVSMAGQKRCSFRMRLYGQQSSTSCAVCMCPGQLLRCVVL